MDKRSLVVNFWKDVAGQNATKLIQYFSKEALIKWHNTNELFTVEEYITANCEYPGKWSGDIERIEGINDTIITVVRVYDLEEKISVHATSFIRFYGDKIIEVDEYWSDDGQPPQWRLDKKIGKQIKNI